VFQFGGKTFHCRLEFAVHGGPGANVDKILALVGRKTDPDRLPGAVSPPLGNNNWLGESRARTRTAFKPHTCPPSPYLPNYYVGHL